MLLDESPGIHSLCLKCNNPVYNTKPTVCTNRFSCRKERLLYLKNRSNVSFNLWVKFWSQLRRSILLLDNLWPPQNWGNTTADFMLLVTKGICCSQKARRGKVNPLQENRKKISWEEYLGISQARSKDIWLQKWKCTDQQSAFQHAKGRARFWNSNRKFGFEISGAGWWDTYAQRSLIL